MHFIAEQQELVSIYIYICPCIHNFSISGVCFRARRLSMDSLNDHRCQWLCACVRLCSSVRFSVCDDIVFICDCWYSISYCNQRTSISLYCAVCDPELPFHRRTLSYHHVLMFCRPKGWFTPAQQVQSNNWKENNWYVEPRTKSETSSGVLSTLSGDSPLALFPFYVLIFFIDTHIFFHSINFSVSISSFYSFY